MDERLTVFLVRHGESEWNAEGRLQGQTPNIPLTALGKRQANQAAIQLTNSGSQFVLSSDLLRAAETAEIIAHSLSVPLRLESDLREQSLGVFEGRMALEVRRETDDENWTDPSWRPSGGESLQDVYLRLERLFSELSHEQPNGRVVVVTHGDTARIALALLQGKGLDGVTTAVLKNGEVVELAVTLAPSSP